MSRGQKSEFLLTSHINFLFIFEQCGDYLFLRRKVGVTESPRSLNPSKAIAMAICPIIVYFSTWRARSMHDVACEFARAFVLSKGRFTRYDKLTTGLRHELFRVNQTYNLLTTVVYIKKNVVGF